MHIWNEKICARIPLVMDSENTAAFIRRCGDNWIQFNLISDTFAGIELNIISEKIYI